MFFAPSWPSASAVLPTLLVTSSLTTLVARTCSHSFACVGQRLRLRPCRLELLRRLDRGPLALGDDAEEIALAHDLDDAGNVLDRALVDAFELGADRRRAHHAAVQHAGHAEVLHVGEAAGHLVRDVDARHRLADDLVVLRVLAVGGLGRGRA